MFPVPTLPSRVRSGIEMKVRRVEKEAIRIRNTAHQNSQLTVFFNFSDLYHIPDIRTGEPVRKKKYADGEK
jgi:hypothetical protein